MRNKRISTTVMVRAALLGTIACVLMQLSLSLPIFPGFLELDVSDVPALIAVITTGPLTGLLVSLIKNLLDPIIFGTSTGGLGNFANFVIGTALVVPIGLIYQRRKNISSYLLGSVVGIVTMVVVASLTNYFILLPLYSLMFMPIENIILMANSVNSLVTDIPTLILFTIVPFNLLKGIVTVLLGYMLYTVLKPVLRHIAI